MYLKLFVKLEISKKIGNAVTTLVLHPDSQWGGPRYHKVLDNVISSLIKVTLALN